MSSSSFSRPGAIDLSQLKQKAQQPPAAAAGAGRAGRVGNGSYVIEVTEQSFEAETVRKSLQHPVVLELYSPRVATGQQLSDALADIANASDGKFLLARLNVDTAPGIVQALQLQAVPTVLALIAGQAAPLFQGVLPKDQVQAAIDQLLQAAVANGIVGRAEPVGAAGAVGGADPAEAAEEDEPDPRFAAADEALARGDFAAAEKEFDLLLQVNPADTEAKAGKAQAGLFARTANLDLEAVLAEAATNRALGVQFDAADAELVSGQIQAAFDRLIALIKATAGDERNQVRVRLLELFETVGSTDPLVVKARRALMTALF